jgi:hypothetical protein
VYHLAAGTTTRFYFVAFTPEVCAVLIHRTITDPNPVMKVMALLVVYNVPDDVARGSVDGKEVGFVNITISVPAEFLFVIGEEDLATEIGQYDIIN